MYMSYCRFEGTLHEMRACMSEVEDHVNEAAEYEVSYSEICNFRNIVYEFRDFLHDMCILDDNGNIDDGELENVCEAMAKNIARNDFLY